MGSAEIERPGMAKYLREVSDAYWKEGMEIMKKFHKYGGSIESKDKNLYNFNLDSNNKVS